MPKTSATATLFTNAVIATMDPARPDARAMLVRNHHVAALGDPPALARDEPNAEVIDLGGRFLCPGFVDAHNHFSLTALEPLSVDCRTPPVASIADLQDHVRDAAAALPSGAWLRGHGYDEAALGRHPTRDDLDTAAPDHPVVLVHWSVHRCVANSVALRLAGIDDTAPDPPGGWSPGPPTAGAAASSTSGRAIGCRRARSATTCSASARSSRNGSLTTR